MFPVINVHASRPEIETYQRLLRSDWNKETLDDVLLLMGQMIVTSVNHSANRWQHLFEVNSIRVSGKDMDKQILKQIRDLSEVFTEPSIPKMPTAFSSNRTQSIAHAEKVWTLLILQALARLSGETGLFLDVQSLLFMCAIHYLLPQLKQQRLNPEHNCLVNAMYVHTLLAWRSQPAHLFYLQSVLMDYLGETQRRLQLLEMSLDVTPIEDHSHLTKATAYWSDLLDLGDRPRAAAFLLKLSKMAPPSYDEEMKEMLTETLCVGHSIGG